jgi:hypothetical protein
VFPCSPAIAGIGLKRRFKKAPVQIDLLRAPAALPLCRELLLLLLPPDRCWCEGGDSNPQALRRWNLNPVRLPIPPPSLAGSALFRQAFLAVISRSRTSGARMLPQAKRGPDIQYAILTQPGAFLKCP